jgi:hypothetical protein
MTLFNEYWPKGRDWNYEILSIKRVPSATFRNTPGKTYFAAPDDCDDLGTLIRQTTPARYYDKMCNILGSQVHICGFADSRPSSWGRLRAAAAETELGVMLRLVK